MGQLYLLEPQFLTEWAGLAVVLAAWLYAVCRRLRGGWPAAWLVIPVGLVGVAGQTLFLCKGLTSAGQLLLGLLTCAAPAVLWAAARREAAVWAGLFFAQGLALPATLFPVQSYFALDYPTWALLINTAVLRGLLWVLTRGLGWAVAGAGRVPPAARAVLTPLAFLLSVGLTVGLSGNLLSWGLNAWR